MSGWSGLARRDARRVFRDRREAGEVLAQELASYRDHNDLLVLGLARGGVPVGWQVAHALRAPLDWFESSASRSGRNSRWARWPPVAAW